MKKIMIFLLAIMSFMIVQNVYAAEVVSIESVDLIDSTRTTEIVNAATHSGLSIKFDVKFNQLYDYAKYKIIIDNPTDVDYEIDASSNFDDSEYITYEFTYEDGNDIVEKNSKTTMFITIKYQEEVPAAVFESGTFTETNNLVISLGNDVIEVPDTVMIGGYIMIVMLLLGISIMIIFEAKRQKSLTLLIIGLILIPSITVFALEKIQINVESIIEIEEPPVCNAFATDDWNTISRNVKLGNTDCYNVGDTKDVTVTGFGVHKVRIANMSTPDECATEGFSQTACGFVLEFTDIIENRIMNETATSVGGYRDSAMREYLNGDFLELLPEELQDVIIDTTVVSGSEANNIDNYVTEDKIYLLSYKEIFNNNTDANDRLSETRQLDYYNESGVGTSTPTPAVKKLGSSNKDWWLRSSPAVYAKTYFTIMYDGGSTYYYAKDANEEHGLSPAFRLG